MSKVVREDIDDLNALLTITLEKEDYESKFNTELAKYRKQANMRGFRKGKMPVSVLKKMYGKAVLADVINDLLQRELYDYLSKEELRILGQPLPSEDQAEVEFELKEFRDYEFKFDLGLAPSFEIEGLSKDNTFSRYQVNIADETVDLEIENARKRHGERVYPEEGIAENDLLKLSVREMEDDAIKQDGVENEFTLLVSSVDSEDVKKELMSKKNGDVFPLNLFQLEKEADEGYVRRYYLGLEDEDDRPVNERFEATIEEISRIEPAELNEAFFKKYFGEDTEVTTEEEAREQVRKNLAKYFESQADALLFRDMQEDLMEKNELPLPHPFLKRWLVASNSDLSEDEVEANYEGFAKNLQWTLIRNKLIREHDLEVGEDEVFEAFKDRVRNYFGGGPANEDLIISMADRLMNDEQQYQQVSDELMIDKLHEVIVEMITVEPMSVDRDEFNQIVNDARQEAESARQPAGEEEE